MYRNPPPGRRDGARFWLMPPAEAARRLDELQEVSNDWLASKGVSERQFSIGFFDRAALARFPCAVVEVADGARIQAFANILPGPLLEEASVDLMRYRSDGPKVMDFMFVSLFLHVKAQGYQRFNLGMAPLASVGEEKGAHLRERMARLLFQHGEHCITSGLRHSGRSSSRLAAALHGPSERVEFCSRPPWRRSSPEVGPDVQCGFRIRQPRKHLSPQLRPPIRKAVVARVVRTSRSAPARAIELRNAASGISSLVD